MANVRQEEAARPAGEPGSDALTAVVLAAGAGTRLGGEPKVWRLLGERPLWWWSLEAFRSVASAAVLVVAPERVEDAARWLEGVPCRVVSGGPSRAESSQRGLEPVTTEWVAIHDAARPCLTPSLIQRVWAAARETGAAIPGIAPADTVKRVAGGRVAETLARDQLVLVQTPQIFRTAVLRRAASQAGVTVTDESGWLEAARLAITVVPGEAENRKITDARDWAWLIERWGR